MKMNTPSLFHSLSYQDATVGMAFLEAVGFRKVVVYTNGSDPKIVDHAEYAWGDNGAVMFGSIRPESPFAQKGGDAKCYCVVDTDDDVDRVYRAALDAGGTAIQEPMNPEYGGRSASVADLEGNLFSFGSYRGGQA